MCGALPTLRFGITKNGRAVAQAISHRLPTAAARIRSPKLGHVVSVVDKVALVNHLIIRSDSLDTDSVVKQQTKKCTRSDGGHEQCDPSLICIYLACHF
jgi:hypothetical protein